MTAHEISTVAQFGFGAVSVLAESMSLFWLSFSSAVLGLHVFDWFGRFSVV